MGGRSGRGVNCTWEYGGLPMCRIIISSNSGECLGTVNAMSNESNQVFGCNRK